MKVGIIGAGAWGCALARCALRAGHDVILWSFDGESKFGIPATTDMSALSDCEVWLAVTPAQFFADTMRRAREFYKGAPIVICTKGLGQGGMKLMSEELGDVLPECGHISVLAGPQFAAEVAAGQPTGTTIAGDPIARAAAIAALPELYFQETDDMIGAQICGVGKNAVALICGYVGARGENEKAMILARAWGEVIRIGMRRGAKIETFSLLCGVGDLFLTATSPTSRNYSAGVAIANGGRPTGTIEGIGALRGLNAMADDMGIDAPVLRQMQSVTGH